MRDQAVADGQQRVALRRLFYRQMVLQHAENEPANNVDQRDDDAGDGITFDELHRAVHGAVELRFSLQTATAPGCLLLGDRPGAQISVDAHLLAWHGVERETR